MLDIDKLQRTIKVCAKFPRRDCEGCEYSDGFLCFHDELMHDFDKAIDLLKEQEPKFVLSMRECETLPNHYERKGFCPKCHQVVEWNLNRAHCGFCGQAVKWE